MIPLIYKLRILIYVVECRLRGVVKGLLPLVSIGSNLSCERSVQFNTINGGHIKIGNNCEIKSGSKLITYGGNIIIGDYCSINPYTMLYGQGNLNIGNNVRIATQCVLIPSNHNFLNLNIPIRLQGTTNKGIIIEDDVWLGCGVKVLDGVTIKKGCVIGAGSVVTTSTEPFGVYVGVPARLIRKRI